MATNERYHYAIGIPNQVFAQRARGKLLLDYTEHAKYQAEYDELGEIRLPLFFDAEKALIVEMFAYNGKLMKTLYRTAYNKDFDLCLVMGIPGRVLTVWLNHATDNHSTLDRSKYCDV